MTRTVMQQEYGISQSNKKAFRNPWVIGWLVLILVVLAVNVGMITTAIVTNPGLVEQDYYERGRDHEQNYIKEKKTKTALGWQLSFLPGEELVVGRENMFRLSAVDRAGQPINGAEVTLLAYRPSDVDADFEVPLEEVAPGVYQGKAMFPLKGFWDVTANVKKDRNSFDVRRRISVSAQ